MNRAARLAVAAILILCLVSCSKKLLKPGTGDIAFRLTWTGKVDLDLHVKDPFGQHIWFHEPTSLSGGLLDIDCNNSIDEACDHPLENVFWHRGNAHSGRYQYWAKLYQTYGAADSVAYTLQILLGQQVIETRSGRLTTSNAVAGPFTFLYKSPGDTPGTDRVPSPDAGQFRD